MLASEKWVLAFERACATFVCSWREKGASGARQRERRARRQQRCALREGRFASETGRGHACGTTQGVVALEKSVMAFEVGRGHACDTRWACAYYGRVHIKPHRKIGRSLAQVPGRVLFLRCGTDFTRLSALCSSGHRTLRSMRCSAPMRRACLCQRRVHPEKGCSPWGRARSVVLPRRACLRHFLVRSRVV